MKQLFTSAYLFVHKEQQAGSKRFLPAISYNNRLLRQHLFTSPLKYFAGKKHYYLRNVTGNMYRSKFIKAENRLSKSDWSSKFLTTQFDDSASIKDIFLSAGASAYIDLTHSDNIVIPVVGKVLIHGGAIPAEELLPGQIYHLPQMKDDGITIKNPFNDETVNFLVIGAMEAAIAKAPALSAVRLNEKNCLVCEDGTINRISIGVYDGRTKAEAILSPKNKNAFVYIINGSFEVENRLMEHRDGLFLWDNGTIGFESLSEHAIILIFECSPL